MSERRRLLDPLYPSADADLLDERVGALIERTSRPRRVRRWSERTAWLIAYPDQFTRPGEAPLVTLAAAMDDPIGDVLSGVHVLPFHPWSSDRGFSVTDFGTVHPAYGSWSDVEELAAANELMADAVLNHASAEGVWFRLFLDRHPGFEHFFCEVDPAADLSAVVRPRSTPLATRFVGAGGEERWVWTTFSADQVDLDYRNPEVLFAAVEIVLSYAVAGASAIRLDAIAFLWKEEGTASIHRPETHAIIRYLRACLDEVDPGILLVTETNVPHPENVSYLGNGAREAQAVYQFSLPPLVLHSFLSGSAAALGAWARDLDYQVADTTFLNFLASHDGVGVRPVEGILDGPDLDRLCQACEGSGGIVNRRRLRDGSEAPYELTGTWFSMIGHGVTEAEALDRHVASHAVALALRGIPLLYAHSLFASGNDRETFARTGHGRDLNRARLELDELRRGLADGSDRRHAAWNRLAEMLRWRGSSPAFHPDSEMAVLDSAPELLLIHRRHAGGARALVAVNVSSASQQFDLPPGRWRSFASPALVAEVVTMPPWSSLWLHSAPGR